MTDEDLIYLTPHGGIMQHIPPTWRDPNTKLLSDVQEIQSRRGPFDAPSLNRAQRRARARRSRE